VDPAEQVLKQTTKESSAQDNGSQTASFAQTMEPEVQILE
jgi:hypothetical protein